MRNWKWLVEDIGLALSLILIFFIVRYSIINGGRFIPLHKIKADYACFWNFIENGYPFTEVCERMGANLKEIKSAHYKKLKDVYTESDYYDFYDVLCTEITRGNGTGHLYPIGKSDYKRFFAARLAAVYPHSKVSDAFYSHTTYGYESRQAGNIETKILEAGKIAYLRIDSFSVYDDEYSKYIATLNTFFKETAGYKHIIIDISQNDGENPECYRQIIGLHIPKAFSVDVYARAEKNKYSEPYLKLYEEISFDIADIPVQLQATNKKFKVWKYAINCPFKYVAGYKPREDKKFWLLLGKKTASAADQFAYICKQSGFATLVGTHTGGKGINGALSEVLPLSKSGLLIRFDPLCGLNPDGTCHDEFGTAPDIYPTEGKSALETCLEAIKKYNAKN